MFWRLLLGTVVMLFFGYLGETFLLPAWPAFIGGLLGWFFILYEIFAGEAGGTASGCSEAVAASFKNMRMIVTAGWSIYPLGYLFGYLLGAEALGGMLVGGITCGFMVAVYMANAGGAWDNAKKFVEAKQLRRADGSVVGKGTDEHAAVVAGDTIGDPFKDTSGPALNILMKLMTMVSLVFANSQFQELAPYDPDKWFIALIIGVLFMILAVGLTLYMRAQGFGKIPKDENGPTI